MSSASALRAVIADVEGEEQSLRRAWTRTMDAVRGPTGHHIDTEFVAPYGAEARRAIAAYHDLARTIASIESQLGI